MNECRYGDTPESNPMDTPSAEPSIRDWSLATTFTLSKIHEPFWIL